MSTFTEDERREVDNGSERKILFVVSSYEGDAGPGAPPPLPPPPRAHDAGVPANATGNHWLVAASSLVNSAIGAGVLSFPYAYGRAGLVGGIVITPIVACMMGYTLYVLAKMGERFGATTYLDLTRKALGRKLSNFVSMLLIVYQFGSCVAYFVIVGDTFSSLAHAYMGHSWLANRRVVLGVFAACVAFPLCLLRRLGQLAAINSFAIIGFVYAATLVAGLGLVTILEREDPMKHVHLFKLDSGLVFSIPIFVFGFTCHSNSVSIMYELAQPRPSSGGLRAWLATNLPQRSSRLQAMIGAIGGAMGVCVLFYTAVGAIGYIAWPWVSGNILNTLPQSNLLVQLARACIGVVVLNHIPMSHFPARASFEHLLKGRAGASVLVSPALSNAFTALFIAGSVGVAMVVTNLGAVVHLLGGTAASMVALCVPGLLLMNASVIKQAHIVLDHAHHAHTHSQEEGGAEHHDHDHIAASAAAAGGGVHEPLLSSEDKWQRASTAGLKATGPLVYVPRNSWAIGVALICVSMGLTGLTFITAVYHK